MKLKNNSILYPGSFDPITYGHVGVIRRFVPIFKPFTILVASAVHKSYWFSLEEREKMIREALKEEFPDVIVKSYNGLTAHFARENNISLFLRGVRSVSDLNYEKELAIDNKKIFEDIETLLVFSEVGQEVISSKLVKEIATHKGDLSHLVPQNVKEAIEQKIKQREDNRKL